jgi:hypothetical protein
MTRCSCRVVRAAQVAAPTLVMIGGASYPFMLETADALGTVFGRHASAGIEPRTRRCPGLWDCGA